MEFQVDEDIIRVDAKEQSNEWLVSAAHEIADVAKERGLTLPFSSGVIAVEATIQSIHNKILAPTRESLSEQLPKAYEGYQATTGFINERRRKANQVPVVKPERLQQEMEAWLTDDKVGYVASVKYADPEVNFTLVATPNLLADYRTLDKAAKAFGKHQPHQTYMLGPFYHLYSPEQLSGTSPDNGNSVVFSLIPSKYTPEVTGDLAQQRHKLAWLQRDKLYLKVPSPLEAVAYWQTLRSAGENLHDPTTLDRTYICHFNLPEQYFGELSVPVTFIDYYGEPSLRISSTNSNENRTRIAVG